MAKEDKRTRTIKIEAVGDFAAGKITPKIRLRGNWLKRAGFEPGNRVSVNCVGDGVIELRSDCTLLALNRTGPKYDPPSTDCSAKI